MAWIQAKIEWLLSLRTQFSVSRELSTWSSELMGIIRRIKLKSKAQVIGSSSRTCNGSWWPAKKSCEWPLSFVEKTFKVYKTHILSVPVIKVKMRRAWNLKLSNGCVKSLVRTTTGYINDNYPNYAHVYDEAKSRRLLSIKGITLSDGRKSHYMSGNWQGSIWP